MRRLRALAALLLLAALIAGVPLVLATTIGNPLDSWDAVKAGDVSSQVVIDLLAAVVWLCWAQFAAATVLEGWSTARHITLPEHVPLVYGGGRALARTLIVTAFMLGPVLGATITAPAAPPRPRTPPHRHTSPPQQGSWWLTPRPPSRRSPPRTPSRRPPRGPPRPLRW